MLASEIMTADVATVEPQTTVAELVALLVARGISAVPVQSGGRLVGIVSEGDLLRRAELGTERKRSRWLEIATPGDRLAAEYIQEHGRKVADVMTHDVKTVQHDTRPARSQTCSSGITSSGCRSCVTERWWGS